MNAMENVEAKKFTTKEFGEFQIDPHEIGKGGFGSVHKATHPRYPHPVAVKKVRVRFDETRRIRRVEDEIECLVKGKHPHVVKFYGSYHDDNYMYIFMEYCDQGSLRQFVKMHTHLKPEDAVYVLKQVIAAVRHLHKSGIIHRDLSAGNILITNLCAGGKPGLFKPAIKLCDFGLARELDKKDFARTVCGTPGYMAPEVLNGDYYSEEADVFSLGMVLFLMLTGEDPSGDLNFLKENLYKVRDRRAEELLRRMTAETGNRIKLIDVCKHVFFKENLAYENENRERAHSASREARRRSKSREVSDLPRISTGSRPQPSQSSANIRDNNNYTEPRRYSNDRRRDNLESIAPERKRPDVPMQRYRAASQPPVARIPRASASNGESGFESGGMRYASSNPSYGGARIPSATQSTAASQKGWPIIIDRITLPEYYVRLKGKVVFNGNMVEFYPEVEPALFEYRFDVSVQGGIQSIFISKSSEHLSLENLRHGYFTRIHRQIHSYQDFPPSPNFKTMYFNLVNLVNHVRSKHIKVKLCGSRILRQYPESSATLMENGDIRVLLDGHNESDRYVFSKIKNNWDRFAGNKKTQPSNELTEINQLRDKLFSLERICTELRKTYPCLVTFSGDIYGDDLTLTFRRMPHPETTTTASSNRHPLVKKSDNIPIPENRPRSTANILVPETRRNLCLNDAKENAPQEIRKGIGKSTKSDADQDNLKGYGVNMHSLYGIVVHNPRNEPVLRRSAADRNRIYFIGERGQEVLELGGTKWPPFAVALYKMLVDYEAANLRR